MPQWIAQEVVSIAGTTAREYPVATTAVAVAVGGAGINPSILFLIFIYLHSNYNTKKRKWWKNTFYNFHYQFLCGFEYLQKYFINYIHWRKKAINKNNKVKYISNLFVHSFLLCNSNAIKLCWISPHWYEADLCLFSF